MGPSRAGALACKVSISEDFGRSGVALNIEKTRSPGDQERRPEEDNVGEPVVGDAVMADDIGRLERLVRWCGMALSSPAL
jgi:hypothetical protein